MVSFDHTPSVARHGHASAWQKWRPLLLSLLLHGTLVGILILFGNDVARSISTEPDRRGAIVLAVAPDDQPDRYVDELDSLASESIDSLLTTEPPPIDAAPVVAIPDLKSPVANLAGPPIQTPTLDAAQMTRGAGLPSETEPFELSQAARDLIAADQRALRARAPKGDPAAVRLFGSGDLEGRSFVFLIDRSKSMGSGGLGVLAAARKELAMAVTDLQPHHRFQIVGYHDRSVSLGTREMLAATDENKRLIPGFIDRLAAFGSTDHLVGLTAALVFNPDVIVFMTDGGYPELNDGQISQLSRLSRRSTTIHCIQFGAGPLQIRTNFMTKLAQKNKGTFRYVDTNQWSE